MAVQEVAAEGPADAEKRRKLPAPLVAVTISAILTALAAHSAFRPGYLLQVDATFGPKAPPYIGGFYVPVWALEKLSVSLFGGANTGRLYLAGVVFFAAFFPVLVLRRYPWWAQAFAGALGVFNPWTYDRLVEGQWTVVAACDGLFLWLCCWELVDKRPTLRSAAALAAATFVVVTFSPHFVGILLVLALAAAIGSRTWESRKRVQAVALSVVVAAVALLPGALLFLGDRGGPTLSQLNGVTTSDVSFFRATGESHVGLIDLFGLYGYWGERLHRFPVGLSAWPLWVVSAGVLVSLAVAGAMIDRRRAWLLAAGYVGVTITMALATGWGIHAFGWLSEHIALLRGYREPEKWSCLWLVALVILGGEAVRWLGTTRRISRPFGVATIGLVFLAIAVPSGVTSVRGLTSIVRPVSYPHSWYSADRYLQHAEKPSSRIMVLPWHLYQTLPFTHGRPVGNPGNVFFSGEIISSLSDDVPGDVALIGSPAWAEHHPSDTCSLASAVRAERADFVLIEPAQGGDSDQSRLLSCGMVSLFAQPQVAVLGWAQKP